MTVWNSTRYPLADTVAGLARRTRIALGQAKASVAVLGGAPPAGDEAGTVDLRPAASDDAREVAELLRATDVAVVPPRDAPLRPGWLGVHLRVLLAGNDVVSVGPAGMGSTNVARVVTGHAHRLTLAAAGNVGFTCDLLSTREPAGTTHDWWTAAAGGARWVFLPGARPVLEVVHLRRPEDCDAALDLLAVGEPGITVVFVDHLGLPAFPLLAEAANVGGASVHVVGPDVLETV